MVTDCMKFDERRTHSVTGRPDISFVLKTRCSREITGALAGCISKNHLSD